MVQTIKLDDTNYDVESLSDKAKATLASLNFATSRIEELTNVQALMLRAKNSYIESLKQEILSNKAGFLFEDE